MRGRDEWLNNPCRNRVSVRHSIGGKRLSDITQPSSEMADAPRNKQSCRNERATAFAWRVGRERDGAGSIMRSNVRSLERGGLQQRGDQNTQYGS